jgi:thiamine-phosphate pyrophosphorylase
MSMPIPRLLAISPGGLAGPADLEHFAAQAEEALAAGLPALLLREPALSDRLRIALHARLLPAAKGARLLLHDSVHLVRALRADGVQLGFRSLSPRQTRSLLLPGQLVGFSAHAHDAPQDREGADFLLAGPVLPTPSKQGLLPVLGFDGLAQLVRQSHVPVLALGGMNATHVARALNSGAHGVAVRAAVFGGRDPTAAVCELLDALAAAGVAPR